MLERALEHARRELWARKPEVPPEPKAKPPDPKKKPISPEADLLAAFILDKL